MKWALPSNDRLRVVNSFSFVFILIYTLWYTTSFQILRQSLDTKSLMDYGMNYSKSLEVAHQLVYPPWSNGFLYPPPNVILRLGLGQLGIEASGVIWMVLLVISTIVCLNASLYLLGLANHPAKYGLGLLALMSVEYFVEWDLRALNGNLIYLVSLLLVLVLSYKSKPYAAGFFLAASIVLKLYSVIFLPYFLFRRQYRLCLAAALWLGLFFFALPMAYFGMDSAVALTASWWQKVWSSSGSTSFPWEYRAYLTSLHKTLLTVLTERGGMGVYNMMNIPEERVLFITRCTQFLWLALVAFYFWFGHRRPCRVQPGTRLMMDAGALTLMTLPLSPILQPHHGVMMLISAIIFVGVVFDRNQPVSLRWSTLAILLSCVLTIQFGPSGSLRGLGMIIFIILFMGGLIQIRTSGYRSASEH